MLTRTLALVVTTGLLLAACGDSDDDETAATTPSRTATATAPSTAGTTPAPPPGGESSSQDAGEIAALVKRSFTSDEDRVACKTFSDRLQREIYGSPAACLRVEDSDDDDAGDPDDMTLAQTRVTGDTASARATAVGGRFDGPLGGLRFARQAGEWRIDRLETDLLRNLLVRTLRSDELAAEPALRSAAVRRCFAGSVGGLPESRLRKFAYDSIAKRDDSEKDIAPALLRCQLRSADGRRQIRRQFERPIRAGVEGLEIPEQAKRCILDRIRETVSLEQVVELSIEQIRTGEQSPRSRELGENAARFCLEQRSN